MNDPVAVPAPQVHAMQVLAQPVVPGAGVPLDMPPAKADAPKLAVTPEQIAWALEAAGALFPAVKKWYPQITIAAGLLLSIGAGLGWWAKAPVAPPVPIVAPVVPPIVPPSPIVPPVPATKLTLTLYTTAAAQGAVAADPALKAVTVTVDQKLYQAGSSYPWQNKSVPLPCAAISRDGAVLDVVPFVTAADLAAAVGKYATAK